MDLRAGYAGLASEVVSLYGVLVNELRAETVNARQSRDEPERAKSGLSYCACQVGSKSNGAAAGPVENRYVTVRNARYMKGDCNFHTRALREQLQELTPQLHDERLCTLWRLFRDAGADPSPLVSLATNLNE